MESVKRGIDGVAWYPYCSLANFEHFAPLLGAEADFAALVGAGPVLDIGCADGDLSFFLEELGVARPIHALDHAGTNHNGLAGIAALQRALGSAVEIHDLNLDEGFELPARPYSMAFCLGLLYHVKNPFHLLESLSRYARTCLLSTRIMSEAGPARAAAYLLDPAELNDDETNFWLFNEAGLRRLVARAGWQLERFYSTGADAQSGDERAFCLLRARRWLANIELGDGWHEESPEGWRWTERRFSFTLRPGPWSSLALHFHLPEALFAQTQVITLTVLGVSYRATEPGIHVLRSRLPAGTVRVECELDRALAPSESDPRELGLIVTEVVYAIA
jgi:2-polyprenyl-3-methyl-5-hydroxy-6-metoxy-1,4-benzoquinol methylase